MSHLISFLSEDVVFPNIQKTAIISWLHQVAEAEAATIKSLNYVFCSDGHLWSLNKKYLKHDTYTDILTFPYSYKPIEADIYISLERVAENAKEFGQGNYHQELCRVMVHGLMHMCGYLDRDEPDKAKMRALETKHLLSLNRQDLLP